MTDLDKRISEYAKWIESRYDDSHELRGKGKNGCIDGKADAYEFATRVQTHLQREGGIVLKRMTAYWWDKDKNAVAISYKDNRLILTVDDAQALLRQLEMLLPERPSRDEPEEPGFYRTRTGAFLRKNSNGAWSALFINGDLIPRYWNDQDDYAKWETVLDCLYPRAFPLTPTIAPYPLKGE